VTDEDIELERQDYLRIAKETWETEEEVHRRFDPGSFGAHEAGDRTFIIYENIESYLLRHPTIAMNKEAFEKTYKAFELLLEVYQEIACDHVKIESGNSANEKN
jgi:hypothetical protein